MATRCRLLHMTRPAIQASISQRFEQAISDAGVAIKRLPDLGGAQSEHRCREGELSC
jgi:hypothetical protein